MNSVKAKPFLVAVSGTICIPVMVLNIYLGLLLFLYWLYEMYKVL